MLPPCDLIIEFLDRTVKSHNTEKPLKVRVTLKVLRKVKIEELNICLYSVAKLLFGQGRDFKEIMMTKDVNDILGGTQPVLEPGVHQYDATFIFADSHMLAPCVRLGFSHGDFAEFQYIVKGWCKTGMCNGVSTVRPIKITPSPGALLVQTDFVKGHHLAIAYSPTLLRDFVMFTESPKGRKQKRQWALTVPFRMSYEYKRKFQDEVYSGLNHVYYQGENLADYLEICLYTPFSSSMVLNAKSLWSKLGSKPIEPQVRILLTEATMKQIYWRAGEKRIRYIRTDTLLHNENSMSVPLSAFEKVPCTYEWDAVKPCGAVTDFEYRFKLPPQLLDCVLGSSFQSFSNALVDLHVTMKLRFGISFVPCMPDKLIDYELNILLVPPTELRTRLIKKQRLLELEQLERFDDLPLYHLALDTYVARVL